MKLSIEGKTLTVGAGTGSTFDVYIDGASDDGDAGHLGTFDDEGRVVNVRQTNYAESSAMMKKAAAAFRAQRRR